jgi:trimeric autotransporter adhesin
MSSRLPIPGGDNDDWGTVLNDYLQQALSSTGTLVTSTTNSYTGLANTNLATGSTPGIVQLAGDISTPVTAPTVVGLQGNQVASTTPTNGQILTWSGGSSQWQPQTPSTGLTGDVDGGSSTSAYGGTTSIDCGDST